MQAMRSDLDHLPSVQRGELGRAVRILMEEFDAAVGGATQDRRRNGRILKIILFGSYAREDWVDEPENGYQSDFDLLVVVSDPEFTDIADIWYAAEDRILRDPEIGRPVNIIVHDIGEVNQSLKRGEYFWVDIVRDGIALYELPGHTLATPMPASAQDALLMADGYFIRQLTSCDNWLSTSEWSLGQGNGQDWSNKAAFALHQATETAYACFLLVRTLYFPRSHNIKFLRSLAEDSEPRLIEAWPRSTKQDRRRFELLKRAYTEARYSANYDISREDLDTLTASVRRLRDLVEAVCSERLDALRIAASETGASQ